MKRLICIIFFYGIAHNSNAQPSGVADSLHNIYLHSTTEEDKVNALNNLANYYYSKKQPDKGDSINNEQLFIAELSNNSDLVLKTYFENKRTAIPSWSSADVFDRTSSFILKGINYAKSISNYDYSALGYSRLAFVYRLRGQNEKAMEYAMNGINLMQQIQSDSIKAIVYLEMGETYVARKFSVEAVKNYNNAYIIALKIRNPSLESRVYRKISELYKDLNDTIEAKKLLLKSVALNKKNKNSEGLMSDYYELGRLTEDTRFVDSLLSLADSLHHDLYILKAKGLFYAIYMTVEKNVKKTRRYLDEQSGLKEIYIKQGIANYYFQLGEIFRWGNIPDSATYYFKLAEPGMMADMDPALAQYVYLEMAASYSMKNDISNAILYYEKTLKSSKQLGDIEKISTISDSLSNLYQRSGNYKTAFEYKILATTTKDSIAHLNKDKDLALMGVDRESRKLQDDILSEQQRVRDQTNIQYMGITIAIIVVFLFMLVLGAFSVSKLTIKILGYFFFISLFEFIVMVLDNEIIHYFTHGEPLKLWLIKIFLIGCLVPFQQWLEHTVLHFLESRKLLRAKNLTLKKWWVKIKKPAPLVQPAPIPENEKVMFEMEGDAPAGVL